MNSTDRQIGDDAMKLMEVIAQCSNDKAVLSGAQTILNVAMHYSLAMEHRMQAVSDLYSMAMSSFRSVLKEKETYRTEIELDVQEVFPEVSVAPGSKVYLVQVGNKYVIEFETEVNNARTETVLFVEPLWAGDNIVGIRPL